MKGMVFLLYREGSITFLSKVWTIPAFGRVEENVAEQPCACETVAVKRLGR